jgi:hypothetical protein
VTSESDRRLGPRPKEFDGGLHPSLFKDLLLALKRNNPGVRPKKLVKTDAWMELKQREQDIVDTLTVEERELWELKGCSIRVDRAARWPPPWREARPPSAVVKPEGAEAPLGALEGCVVLC